MCFTDNIFTSGPLLEELYEEQIYVASTIQKSVSSLPFTSIQAVDHLSQVIL